VPRVEAAVNLAVAAAVAAAERCLQLLVELHHAARIAAGLASQCSSLLLSAAAKCLQAQVSQQSESHPQYSAQRTV
jgi:hypothetical protein